MFRFNNMYICFSGIFTDEQVKYGFSISRVILQRAVAVAIVLAFKMTVATFGQHPERIKLGVARRGPAGCCRNAAMDLLRATTTARAYAVYPDTFRNTQIYIC